MPRILTSQMQELVNCPGGDASSLTTLAVITRTDNTVARYTTHNSILSYDGNNYLPIRSLNPSDVQTSDALDVDNLNVTGGQHAATMTDEEVADGLWDYAEFRVFMVNHEDPDGGFGEIKVRKGWLGEVSTGRVTFEVELRGMMQPYSRIIGRVYGPDCDATLGDSRCQVAIEALRVTGIVEAVSEDQLTIADSARTEAGPTGGVAITSITQADPGVVTTATAHGFIEAQPVVHSGIGGMLEANGPRTVHNPTTTTYEIEDTTGYSAYTSGGETSAATADAGYFTYGVLTFTTGANAGLSMQIKSFGGGDSSFPGMLTFELPFPHTIEVGDEYTLVPGCAKTLETCINKFSNVQNFRGFPHLRGNDALIQVGRRSS